MRVSVKGDSGTAASLRGLLLRTGVVFVTDERADYVIHIEQGLHAGHILLDSVDSDLEYNILSKVRTLTSMPVTIQTAGGIQSDRECRIVLPFSHDAAARAVEVGVMRGVLATIEQTPMPSPASGGEGKPPWYSRALSFFMS
jgi:hypothetical protein